MAITAQRVRGGDDGDGLAGREDLAMQRATDKRVHAARPIMPMWR